MQEQRTLVAVPIKEHLQKPNAAPNKTPIKQKKNVLVSSGMGSSGFWIRKTRKIARPGRGTHLQFSRHSLRINAFTVSLQINSRLM